MCALSYIYYVLVIVHARVAIDSAQEMCPCVKQTHLDLAHETDDQKLWVSKREEKPFCKEGDSMRECLRSQKKKKNWTK